MQSFLKFQRTNTLLAHLLKARGGNPNFHDRRLQSAHPDQGSTLSSKSLSSPGLLCPGSGKCPSDSGLSSRRGIQGAVQRLERQGGRRGPKGTLI